MKSVWRRLAFKETQTRRGKVSQKPSSSSYISKTASNSPLGVSVTLLRFQSIETASLSNTFSPRRQRNIVLDLEPCFHRGFLTVNFRTTDAV